jgi:very-short-patch-repair endonuclease
VDWRPVLRETIQANDGLATRQQLLRVIPSSVLDGHIGRRQLVRVFPHVYRLKDEDDDGRMTLRAALLHAGPASALSHSTALNVWGEWRMEQPIHLTVNESLRRAGAPALIVHRRKKFDPESVQCVERHGLRVTTLPRTVIDSWPLLPPDERRPLALDLARRGRVTADLLDEALSERPNVAGRRLLRQTIDLIAAGCQSELEAHGVVNVFRHRSLPPSVGQFRITLSVGRVHVDRAWPEVKLAVELDGARYHTSPGDRRRDLARDTALAALGWVVLRFTYAEVVRDPEVVRAKILDVYRTRLAQLRVG